MNKFVMKAIEKQNGAYTLNYAQKEFLFSCDMCVSRNLLRCDCSCCPIALAYQDAVVEIKQGKRKPNRDYRTFRDSKGHVTVVVNNCKNTTVNVTIK